MRFQQSLSHNNYYYLKYLVKNLFLPFYLIFDSYFKALNENATDRIYLELLYLSPYYEIECESWADS